MDAQEFRSLQEAYLEIIENQQLNEGYKNFPYDKVKTKAKKLAPGRDDLGREPLTGPKAPNTPQKDLNRATKLRLAAHLHHSEGPKQREKINKGPESLLYKKRSKTVSDSYDYYDIILSHLLDEGYAETQEQAEVIMVNMSEEWREEIVEARDDDAKEMRRLAAAERRAGKSDRMDAKTAAKYAGSEAKSAERADKKSKGKHIHGYAIDEAKDDSYLETDMNKRRKNNEKAIADMKKTKAHADMVKAARKHFDEETEIDEGMTMKDFKQQRSRQKQKEKRAAEKTSPLRRAGIHHPSASPERAARHRANVDPDFEGNDERNYPGGKLSPKKVRKARAVGELTKEQLELELRAHLRERALDASEKKEKESVFKAIKPSKLAKSYPEKSPEQLRSLRYAISTAQAKKNMDTSRSDKRYGVER